MCRQGHDKERLSRREEEGLARSEGQGEAKREAERRSGDVKKDGA